MKIDIAETKIDSNYMIINTFSSFEEMENNQLEYFASLEPIMVFYQLKQLVLAAYGFSEEPLLNSMTRIIHFKAKK